MIKHITSGENSMLKKVSRLLQKKHRDAEAEFVAEGINSVKEAIINGADITFAVVREGFSKAGTENAQLLLELEEKVGTIVEVPDKLFDKLASSETPQGILVTIAKKIYSKDEFFTEGNFVVLDRLQDPGNIGTIIRTADAAGYKGAIIIKGTADIYSPKVVRAAAGSLFRLPVLFSDSPENATALLRTAGKRIVCTTPHTRNFYYDVDLTQDVAVVIGNEAGGACGFFIENADIAVKIPMQGTIESLNAAIAAGIIMYESVRQKA